MLSLTSACLSQVQILVCIFLGGAILWFVILRLNLFASLSCVSSQEEESPEICMNLSSIGVNLNMVSISFKSFKSIFMHNIN